MQMAQNFHVATDASGSRVGRGGSFRKVPRCSRDRRRSQQVPRIVGNLLPLLPLPPPHGKKAVADASKA